MVLIGPNTASALLLVAIMTAIVIWLCWDQLSPVWQRITARLSHRYLVTSSDEEDEPVDIEIAPSQSPYNFSTNRVATPQNGINPGFVIAPEVEHLAQLLEADPLDIAIMIEVLAQLCIAEKHMKRGPAVKILGQTDAIKYGFAGKITIGSGNPKYEAARTALQSRIRELSEPAVKFPPMTPEQQLFREQMGLEARFN